MPQGGANLIGVERLCAALADPDGASGLQKLTLQSDSLPARAGVLLANGLKEHASLEELMCAALRPAALRTCITHLEPRDLRSHVCSLSIDATITSIAPNVLLHSCCIGVTLSSHLYIAWHRFRSCYSAP